MSLISTVGNYALFVVGAIVLFLIKCVWDFWMSVTNWVHPFGSQSGQELVRKILARDYRVVTCVEDLQTPEERLAAMSSASSSSTTLGGGGAAGRGVHQNQKKGVGAQQQEEEEGIREKLHAIWNISQMLYKFGRTHWLAVLGLASLYRACVLRLPQQHSSSFFASSVFFVVLKQVVGFGVDRALLSSLIIVTGWWYWAVTFVAVSDLVNEDIISRNPVVRHVYCSFHAMRDRCGAWREVFSVTVLAAVHFFVFELSAQGTWKLVYARRNMGRGNDTVEFDNSFWVVTASIVCCALLATMYRALLLHEQSLVVQAVAERLASCAIEIQRDRSLSVIDSVALWSLVRPPSGELASPHDLLRERMSSSSMAASGGSSQLRF